MTSKPHRVSGYFTKRGWTKPHMSSSPGAAAKPAEPVSSTVREHIGDAASSSGPEEEAPQFKPLPDGSFTLHDVYLWEGSMPLPDGSVEPVGSFIGDYDGVINEIERQTDGWDRTQSPNADVTKNEVTAIGMHKSDRGDGEPCRLDFVPKAVRTFRFGVGEQDRCRPDLRHDAETGEILDGDQVPGAFAVEPVTCDPEFTPEQFDGTISEALEFLEECHWHARTGSGYQFSDAPMSEGEMRLDEIQEDVDLVPLKDGGFGAVVESCAMYTVIEPDGSRLEFAHALSLTVEPTEA